MKYSKEQIITLSEKTEFRAEILEKVLLLMNLLEYFFNDPLLKEKIVLKGGTALNLFYLEMPRLSVDIDLNYIGELDREKMLQDRKQIEERIISICELQKFVSYRQPSFHAGDKLMWRYPSALGHTGNLEVDLNFMYRVPILPIKQKTSIQFEKFVIKNVNVLDIHELAAGKLSALFTRSASRDLFDTYHLFTQMKLDTAKMRLAFVIYMAMTTIEISKLNKHHLQYNLLDIRNKLLPVLRQQKIPKKDSELKYWADNLLDSIRASLSIILPLRSKEEEFIRLIREEKAIRPNLITNNSDLQKIILNHPAIKWATMRFRSNK